MRKVKCDYKTCDREVKEGKEFTIDFYSNIDGLSRELQFCDKHGVEIYNKICNGEVGEFSVDEDTNCRKCELLAELYNQVEETPRNYWIMTELFTALHNGKDYCKGVTRTELGDQVIEVLKSEMEAQSNEYDYGGYIKEGHRDLTVDGRYDLDKLKTKLNGIRGRK